jgi:hypothetical protein
MGKYSVFYFYIEFHIFYLLIYSYNWEFMYYTTKAAEYYTTKAAETAEYYTHHSSC